jgi:hypothetical protein
MYIERKTNGTTQKTEAFEAFICLVFLQVLLCHFYDDILQNMLNLQL